jgi:hypothetical protein
MVQFIPVKLFPRGKERLQPSKPPIVYVERPNVSAIPGTLETDLAIYRVRVRPVYEHGAVTLAGFFNECMNYGGLLWPWLIQNLDHILCAWCVDS